MARRLLSKTTAPSACLLVFLSLIMALKGGGKEGAQLSAFIWDPFSRFMATKLNQLTSFVPPPPREPHAPPRKVLLVSRPTSSI